MSGLGKVRTKDGWSRVPTTKQKMAVDLIVSGNAKNLSDAARKAGYKGSTVKDFTKTVLESVGVRAYLKTLDDLSRTKFGLSLPDKVMSTYYDALEATKLYGKNAIEHPDHATRIASADRLSRFLGWGDGGAVQQNQGEHNQFNFFNVSPEKHQQFHENLKNFIKKNYHDGP